MALSGDEPPIVVIGELKLAFNLELILQAVDRAAASDEVWLAAKFSERGKDERAMHAIAISAAGLASV